MKGVQSQTISIYSSKDYLSDWPLISYCNPVFKEVFSKGLVLNSKSRMLGMFKRVLEIVD